ncbi:hypothetical protein [Micromonospora rubida]
MAEPSSDGSATLSVRQGVTRVAGLSPGRLDMSASTADKGVVPRTLPFEEYAVRVAGWPGGIRVVPAFDASIGGVRG